MECKNCDNKHMDVDERDWEDGMAVVVYVCLECGYSCKSWHNIEEPDIPPHISWINEKGESAD